ncbi:hypothetical protein SDC9_160827 [bioreactor metagenome]|uniref:Uncharacterized protein n=1 Tax=bioreactor metagenome TaxID=1076179 RepID=A0A645FIP2_9ZZZZ
MRIPKVLGYGSDLPLFCILHGGRHGHHNTVALLAFTYRDDGLGQRQPCLGHADKFKRLGRGDCQQHGLGVGHAHIFTGMGDHAPRDQPGVAAGIHKPRKPQQRRVRI